MRPSWRTSPPACCSSLGPRRRAAMPQRERQHSAHTGANGTLAIGLALIVVAVVLQLVPLSRQTLLAVSPAADTFLQRYEIAYASRVPSGQAVAHSLSIEPAKTRLGLMLLLGLSVFLL